MPLRTMNVLTNVTSYSRRWQVSCCNLRRLDILIVLTNLTNVTAGKLFRLESAEMLQRPHIFMFIDVGLLMAPQIVWKIVRGTTAI